MDTHIIIAALIATIVTVVSWKSLREMSTLNNPVIPICVGAIVFLAFASDRGAQLSMLLIPYEALAIAIVVCIVAMFLLALLRRASRRRDDYLAENDDRFDRESHETGDDL